LVYSDYQEQIRKKKEETAARKQQNQPEPSIDHDEDDNAEPTDE